MSILATLPLRIVRIRLPKYLTRPRRLVVPLPNVCSTLARDSPNRMLAIEWPSTIRRLRGRVAGVIAARLDEP
jgi:hypothetical protein